VGSPLPKPQHLLLASRSRCNSLGESASTQVGIIEPFFIDRKAFIGQPAIPARWLADEAEFSSPEWSKIGGKFNRSVQVIHSALTEFWRPVTVNELPFGITAGLSQSVGLGNRLATGQRRCQSITATNIRFNGRPLVMARRQTAERQWYRCCGVRSAENGAREYPAKSLSC
jgi:hypothetical protein